MTRKRRSLSSNLLYDPTQSTRSLIREGAPFYSNEKREYKRSDRKAKSSVCFSLFAGHNSATTCKEILDALYFPIKEGAQRKISERREYKRSDRQAENSFTIHHSSEQKTALEISLRSLFQPKRARNVEQTEKSVQRFSSITEGAQHHSLLRWRYKRSYIPAEELSIVVANARVITCFLRPPIYFQNLEQCYAIETLGCSSY